MPYSLLCKTLASDAAKLARSFCLGWPLCLYATAWYTLCAKKYECLIKTKFIHRHMCDIWKVERCIVDAIVCPLRKFMCYYIISYSKCRPRPYLIGHLRTAWSADFSKTCSKGCPWCHGSSLARPWSTPCPHPYVDTSFQYVNPSTCKHVYKKLSVWMSPFLNYYSMSYIYIYVFCFSDL